MTSPQYQSGFCNDWVTEALPGALPEGRNSPQDCPYGLYAEQLSGTAFTVPRSENRRSWLYRIRPAAAGQQPFSSYGQTGWSNQVDPALTPPHPLRWDPPAFSPSGTDFVDGVSLWASSGVPNEQSGVGIYSYAVDTHMQRRFFYDADGELLFVPQQGGLRLATELGLLDIVPGEIAVIPRGVRFRVELHSEKAAGYLLENYGVPLRLPELGPIGSNGLANPRDFQVPVAWFEDIDGDFELIAKFGGGLWHSGLGHSPLDVVAWHGTYAPYKYDLRRFNTIGSISYDHPDPSIFTVLTSPSEVPGAANLDFVVFPPRILAMENTFRPPWFHRNVANEFMGLIHGIYDAKADGFMPGGASLHNCMSSHGPDAETVEQALALDTSTPQYLRDTLAFMFETRRVIHPSVAALNSPGLQKDYLNCWQSVPKRFSPHAGPRKDRADQSS